MMFEDATSIANDKCRRPIPILLYANKLKQVQDRKQRHLQLPYKAQKGNFKKFRVEINDKKDFLE